MSSRTGSMDYLPPNFSELRIWLLGEDRNDKISLGNLLLQKTEFETEASPSHLCAKKGRGQFQDLNISVVLTPNLFDRDVPETEITRALVNCEAMSAPGPHVLLLILQPETSTEKLRDMIKIMNSWSDQTMKHTIVLLMEGEKKFNSTNESKLVISLLKERLRWQKCNRIQTDQFRLVTELFGLITNLNEVNERNHLILDIYESTTEMQSRKILKRKCTGFSDIKDRTGSFLQGSSQSAKDEAMPVLNLVLFGSSSAVKTSAVNTILGPDESSEASELKTLYECVKREGVICGHHVNVIEMPQLYSTSVSRKDVMQGACSAMSLCSFNINTFLLVLNVSPLTDEDKGELEVISDIFDTPDKKFWDSLMVLFIYQGNRQDKAVTEFIHGNRDIKELLRKCGHNILSIDQRPNHEQLLKLLQKIKMVPCYSYDTCLRAQLEKRIQLEARNKEMEEENRSLNEIKRKAETECQRSRTNIVRIALVGKTGNGKSATGNTILNRKAFKSQASFKSLTSTCQKEHGFVEGTPVVVVDTPGLFDTQLSQEEVKAEILKCISLLSPGPHVFLLVLRVGRFTNDEKETLNLIKESFGKNAEIFTIIIFTHGDLLEDQTIESCLEDADPQMKKLIRDCGERYHVIDNTKQDESKQVIDLLEKINRMVEKNGGGCYTNEMFEEAEAAIKLEIEKILKEKEEEMEREKKRIHEKYREEMAEIERRMKKERELMERERKIREEELRVKEEFLKNELKRRDEQQKKEREQAEEQRRIEEERKQEQWANEWKKIEEKRIRLEEEQQKRDQEYRERYEIERREMEKRHKDRLKRKQEEEYQKKLKEERSEWELKEKKMTEEFEQEKRKREDKEKERIEKEQKEKERIEKDYENSKIEISRQIEEWEKLWVEEWNKRVNEERKRREAEREKLMKLEDAFERERKEEEEKRRKEDKARREQEERDRREMEEQYEWKLEEMKRKYEDEARKHAEEFNEFRLKYVNDFQALMLKHDIEMQEMKRKHEKECQDIEKECAQSASCELSKHKNRVLRDKLKEMEERHQTEVDTLRERYEDRCVLL